MTWNLIPKTCFLALALLIGMVLSPAVVEAAEPALEATNPDDVCERVITLKVVALDQPWMWNRAGSAQPMGMMFALERDVVPTNTPINEFGNDVLSGNPTLEPGKVRLRSGKRARPFVLRINDGDCIEARFTNLLNPTPPNQLSLATRNASFHIAGVELIPVEGQAGIDSDGSWVGANRGDMGSLAAPGQTRTYKLYAPGEGTYTIYNTPGDPGSLPRAEGGELGAGFFGVLNVQPKNAEWYRSQVTREDLRATTYRADRLPENMSLEPADPELCREKAVEKCSVLKVFDPARQTGHEVLVVEQEDGRLLTADSSHPLIDYQAVYASGRWAGSPVLSMLQAHSDGTLEYIYSDLTAIITGPNAGRFPDWDDSPRFRENPALPDRRQPYREFTSVYHESLAVQPFEQFYDPYYFQMLLAGQDSFAINYGMSALGVELLSSRMGRGPGGGSDSVELKFEEFFLSSWAMGDPAMVVDVPANVPNQVVTNPAEGMQVPPDQTDQLFPTVSKPLADRKATKAFYPDDPSNVYHSYMRDHVKFRIYHNGQGIPHVHHQHAHQWLHAPNSDDSHYLDSQLINPGASYSLEMVYNGSGNRNQTVGDSIFHCHFYPHFATGMWALWRVHDVFEEGTFLDRTGRPKWTDDEGRPIWNRAYPDGEIESGTPIPAVVPVPTLPMAPIPAPVRLVDQGRRVEVKPEGTDPQGQPIYGNPGYPFFIPGVAGHRAPHPPMDFAWEEESAGVPRLDESGNKIYLDGGLPRHLILGGETVREFHTRWDFSKDFIRYDEAGEPVAGGLRAFHLPEEGTLLEKAAMETHAIRARPSFQPDGQPGNFILNGLPPTPGAPFADPSVSDDGNQIHNTRRYQAAVIQKDIVINKKGWHFPQSRIITLWEDVAPTVRGDRPPQPFYFRSNSGESVELWHTNLVPNYYELDDFQVRTPTDILGQHIHLVKFDVTSSDGATNGFNYEDGTLSPDEVRERIDAVNLYGGLYAFDEKTQFIDPDPARQRMLTPKPADPIFGDPPPYQDWTGAQTTIQRFDTDPLLNNDGFDRTMRTVFTHDHYGPSTHQATGLYGGMLIEPADSEWFDPITGERLYDPARRKDGGPTSWQANIVTPNPEDSFREFAFTIQDSQLAYTRQSRSTQAVPDTALFSIDGRYSEGLDAGQITEQLALQFSFAGVVLTDQATVQVVRRGERWRIDDRGETYEIRSTVFFDLCGATDDCAAIIQALDAGNTSSNDLQIAFFNNGGISLTGTASVDLERRGRRWVLIQPSDWLNYPVKQERRYRIRKGGGNTLNVSGLKVYIPSIDPGWSDYQFALNPLYNSRNAILGPPYSNLVNFFPAPGTHSVNYRNEPLPLRVAVPSGESATASANATDLAYIYNSIPRLDPDLNRQPAPSEPINPDNPDGFKFPRDPLVPRGPTGAQPTDPYTPLLRAYENDPVQIRVMMGANHDPQYFSLPGVMWLSEPSYTNSGHRNVQDFGVSEHFEFLFTVAPASTSADRPFTDYPYLASSGQEGLMSGMWGILRAWDGRQGLLPDLQPLPNNPQGHAEWSWSDLEIPPDATVRSFEVVATTSQQALPEGALIYNTRGQSTCPVDLNSDNTCPEPLQMDETQAIRNPYAVLYFHAEDLDEDGKLKEDARDPEPLILRVAAGDWVQVTLRNAIDPEINLPGALSLQPLGQNPPGTPYSTYETQINLDSTSRVSLHPQLLSYDMSSDSGMNVGFNPDQTAGPGETVTYTWYAGDLEFDTESGQLIATPVEFGTTNLFPAEPFLQHRSGLIGALIVEPENSTWVEDTDSRASANVTTSDGTTFREFVVMMQDNSMTFSKEPLLTLDAATYESQLNQGIGSEAMRQEFENAGITLATGQGDGLNITTEEKGWFWQIRDQARYFGLFKNGDSIDVHKMYIEAVNYGVEPFPYRYAPQAGGFDPNSTDFTESVSNQLVGDDPQTPIYVASAGTPVRFRLAHPEGLRPIRPNGEIVMIHGHSWQEQPYTHDSTKLGYNPLSEWQTSRGSHGPRDRYDILLDSAGGTMGVTGDYLYRTYGSDEYTDGIWGIFRVVEPDSDGVVISRAEWSPNTGAITARGTITVDPATGRFADSVHVYCLDESGDLTPLATLPVSARNGAWRFEKSGLKLPENARLRVRSSGGGQADRTMTVVGRKTDLP